MQEEPATRKVTASRDDDAAGQQDHHMAGRPPISMVEQAQKRKDGELWGSHCQACKYDQISPMLRCPKCASKDVVSRQFATTGQVVSYTIQTVAPEQYMNEVPYAFAIIQLDDGPRVSGWIGFINRPSDLPKGQKVAFVSSYKPGMQFEKA